MTSGFPFKLTIADGPEPGKVYDLTQAMVKIGRDETKNTLILPMPGVSREHAVLKRQGDAYTIEDLNSANGTFVNGARLAPGVPRALHSGDRVGLGLSVSLVYQATAPAAVAETAAQPSSPTTPHAPSVGQTAFVAEPPPTISRGQKPVAAPSGAPAAPGQTVFMAPSEEKHEPPQLVIETAGEGKKTVTLTDTFYTFGRAEDNSIQVSSRIVSRHHARLERVNGGYRIVPDPNAANPLHYQGRPLTEPRLLKHKDLLRIGGQDPGTMVTLTYLQPSMAEALAPVTVNFGQRDQIQIGRDPQNDVVLDVPVVSRFHAIIQRVGSRYRVRDLRSVNGTFVNDQRVDGEMWLNPNDSVRIGPYRFVLGEDRLVQHDESGGLQVDVLGLNKWVRKDLNILQNIYLAIKPREFIVVVGQSGGGKSTLVDAIAGYRPATHGQVLVNGINVYQNFDAVRNEIGFVPQRDIIHMELTVYQALDYAAQLRMPADTSPAERRKRILEVLEDLDLTQRKDTPVHRLSGGQQKRVSIGVELLTKPGLFFLDEPTSGLDPGTETALMQLMRRLADQGRTIILITHATKNVMLADKVIFLARGGYLAWFGPPEEALKYFDQYRTDRERRAKDIEFDEIYSILEDPQRGNPKEWAARYQQHPAYQQYIVQPLQHHTQALALAGGTTGPVAAPVAVPVARPAARPKRQISSIRQFFILSTRNLNILVRDRFSLLLMLLTAPIVALLTSLVAKRDAFDVRTGTFPEAITGLFLLIVFAIIVGIMSQMREIVKEQDIYKRERLVNLKILPYVMSKVWVAGLLALYHSAVYLVARYMFVDMPGGYLEFGLLYITLTLATMAGMMLGLFASALAPNNNAAPLIATLFVVPQILLGGALLPLNSLGPAGAVLSVPVTARWAFEANMTITGIGKDVATDVCWLQPKEVRQGMDAAAKDANCHCLGINMFKESAQFGAPCYFPGLAMLYDPALDLPAPPTPEEPLPPGPPPPFPELREPPDLPENPNDRQALQAFANDYTAWRGEFAQTVGDFKAQMAGYQAQVQAFQEQTAEFQRQLDEYRVKEAERQAGRAKALNGGEAMLEGFYEKFGDTYNVNVLSRWFYQVVISVLLFAGILILQKRKDVV